MIDPTPPCRACGKVEPVLCFDDSGAICPDCCDKSAHEDAENGHVWKYDRGERGLVCTKCGIPKRDTVYAFED